MALALISSAFADGSSIPRRHTCDGEDLSPPLSWAGAPAGARSFVLLCDDPDAPAGTWHHWALFDIPAAVDHLDEGCATRERVGAMRQAVNDFGRTGYGGPCPPRGHGPHHYHFRLFAIGLPSLDLRAHAKCADVERAARSHSLGTAQLVGTYSR